MGANQQILLASSRGYPLDPYSSGLIVAGGMRRLLSSYSGPLMQVRRSSDNTTLDIGFTASGALDSASLLAFTGAGDGFVSKLYDQTGQGSRDVVQATAGNQLQIVSSGSLLTEMQGSSTNAGLAGPTISCPSTRSFTSYLRGWGSSATGNMGFVVTSGGSCFENPSRLDLTVTCGGIFVEKNDNGTNSTNTYAFLFDGDQVTGTAANRAFLGNTELTNGTITGTYAQPSAITSLPIYNLGAYTPSSIVGTNYRLRAHAMYSVAHSQATITAINAALA